MNKKEEEGTAVSAPSPFEKSIAKRDLPKNYKAVSTVTRDVMTLTKLGEAIVLCQSEVYPIHMDSVYTPGDKHPVACVDCFDPIRGVEFTLACNAVLASSFSRFNGSLKGMYFAIRVGEMVAGKRYRKTDVVVLERVE